MKNATENHRRFLYGLCHLLCPQCTAKCSGHGLSWTTQLHPKPCCTVYRTSFTTQPIPAVIPKDESVVRLWMCTEFPVSLGKGVMHHLCCSLLPHHHVVSLSLKCSGDESNDQLVAVPNPSGHSFLSPFWFACWRLCKGQILYLKSTAPKFKTKKQTAYHKKNKKLETHSLCRTAGRLTSESGITLRSSQPWHIST